jgi:DNA-binding transcriptional LysR family regulator
LERHQADVLPRSRQVQYLVAVVEEGQLTSAAKRMKVAQPVLSQAIARLEDELGVKLLDRRPRGVSATPAGDAFIRAAMDAVAAEQDALQMVEELARETGGEILVGFIGPPPAIVSPSAFEQFAHSYPDVHLAFRDLPFPHGPTRSWLGQVDAAICHRPMLEDGLAIEPLRSEARAIVAPKANPLAQERSVAVADALGERFVSYHPTVQPQWAGFHSLDDHRGARPQHTTDDHALTSLQMLGILSSGSGAVTAIPIADARLVEHVLPGVAAVALTDAAPAEISLIWRRDGANPLVEALAGALQRSAVADGV